MEARQLFQTFRSALAQLSENTARMIPFLFGGTQALIRALR
jgi:hypothetical protein